MTMAEFLALQVYPFILRLKGQKAGKKIYFCKIKKKKLFCPSYINENSKTTEGKQCSAPDGDNQFRDTFPYYIAP